MAATCWLNEVSSWAAVSRRRPRASWSKFLVTATPANNWNSIMSLVKWAIKNVAPIFMVTSPVTSYADQIWSIHKNRSSAGFSLDIPLIMLVSSILK